MPGTILPRGSVHQIFWLGINKEVVMFEEDSLMNKCWISGIIIKVEVGHLIKE